MENFRKPYEISLWEDILTFVVDNEGVITEYEKSLEGAIGTVVAQYYKERKICTIGSNTMDSPIRAVNGKIKSNINGSNELTFDMYSHYYDEESDQLVSNPFIKLLVNERKIKLRYGELGAPDTKWYDLIIKRISENSETKVFSYTAQDLFINELSKSGFNLEFDQELENNTGNIKQLANAILAESDWKLNEDDCDLLRQTIEEPLYEITLGSPITPWDMITNEPLDRDENNDPIPLSEGTKIYAFYNCIVNKTPFFQFLYNVDDKYPYDDDHVIISESNWYVDNVQYDEEGVPNFVKRSNDGKQTPFMYISEEYRGKRLVRKIKTHYDASIDKYVGVYKDKNNSSAEVYGYTETTYNSPATVRNFITNGTEFTDTTGWEVGGKDSNFPGLTIVSIPDIKDLTWNDSVGEDFSFSTYLKFDTTKAPNEGYNQKILNSTIINHSQYIDGFIKGESFVFRIKYGIKSGGEIVDSATTINFQIAKATLSNGEYKISDNDVYFFGEAKGGEHNTLNYITVKTECRKSLPYSELIEMGSNFGLFLSADRISTLYIEDVQFFRYVPVTETDNGTGAIVTRPLLPDEIWTDSQVQETYYFYAPNPEYKSIDDVEFIYQGETIPSDIVPAYNDEGENKYEKVRSITEKESNRFNLIQKLCETFECWPKFEIDHDAQTGRILVDEQYRQRKWVSFREYVGKDNYAGFKYGINLKGIIRDVNSETITSKVIVKNNANEFGRNGFCSIARALENPSGENYILDFSYYIQHGLLSLSEITNDLYENYNGYIGFYKELKRINALRDEYVEEQAQLLKDLADYQANVTTYTTLLNEAEEQKRDQLAYVKSITGKTAEQLLQEEDKTTGWWDNDKVIEVMTSIARLNSIIPKYENYKEAAEENLANAQDQYDQLTRILSSDEKSENEPRLLLQKQQLNQRFYQKYSRFLQEGSWISEDYIDDELYYLDARGTARTSSKPQITYTIQVLEISQLEGYENYTFSVGDKTTMEDTEFFGWVFSNNGTRSPYREEVIVSEVTNALDSPEQNEIKVQNYKTQFEDLFQRITATTQSIEYHTGEYSKVSSIVEPNGTINFTTLQNSLANNAFVLSNSQDQSVEWDETGFRTTSLRNPAEIVRIVSGGIFLSTDGGSTWNTGITGRGINANYLTAGQLDVNKINIMNGSFPSFRWDGNGLNAYSFSINETTGEPQNFNYNQFVRLDQYGLYGMTGENDFIPENEQDVKNNAQFALTWSGFQIKSNNNGGYVSITSNGDFQVFKDNNELIKIGRLDDKSKRYGLRIRDGGSSENKIVMEQDSNGKMWIRDELNIGGQSASTSMVKIGYLSNLKPKDENNQADVHEVINANNEFIVYEDGSMRATDGYFEGTINATDGNFTGIINATGGSIGGLTVDQVVEGGYKVVIKATNGPVFKNDQGSKTLTAHLYAGAQEIVTGISYQWTKNGENLDGKTENELEVYIEDFGNEDNITYGCVITYDATSE